MIWLGLYLLAGLVNVVLGLLRDRYDFKPHPVTILGRDGKPARYKPRHRDVGHNLVYLLLDLVLWPVPLIFWCVFVPIHDLLAKYAWEHGRKPE